jgi:hypothetical protein
MIKFCFGLILAAPLLLASAKAEPTLTALQLRALAPGSYDVEVMDSVSLTVKLFKNGKMAGELGNDSDTGRWRVSGNRLCIVWTKWLRGETRCSTLVRQEGELKGDGLSIRRI